MHLEFLARQRVILVLLLPSQMWGKVSVANDFTAALPREAAQGRVLDE
jgi:hypothetical protein